MTHDANPSPLVVAITTRALFDLEAEHQVFLDEGEEGYMALQRARQGEPLRWGMAYPLVRKILSFNTAGETALVEVVILSRNDPMTGLRVMGTLQKEGLPIERAIFTKGRSPFQYLAPLGVSLFLSAEPGDVHGAALAGCASALILPKACSDAPAPMIHEELHLALDGDAVLFSPEAEAVFLNEGPEAFHVYEQARASIPMAPGPFQPLLAALVRLKAKGLRIRTTLITARAVQAHERALRTLDAWGLPTDEALFLCGKNKAEFLAAMAPQPDFFFDDSVKQVSAARDHVPTGLVPRAV